MTFLIRARLTRFVARSRTARFTPAKIERLLADPAIVRNRLKVESAVNNAKRVLEVRRDVGSLDAYLWSFVGGRPIVGAWASMMDIPASTAESVAMSKDLKEHGFSFVGTTIVYAFMQACGMVDDHLLSCWRRADRPAR